MPAWEKWKDFEGPTPKEQHDAIKKMHRERVFTPPAMQHGGSLRHNTPRNEKFGSSLRIAGVRAK